MNWFFYKTNGMVIIGFEDSDGNPVVKTEEEKKKFLEMSHMNKDDVTFADADTTIPKLMNAIIWQGN
jgi:hypothetical protein